MKTSVSRTLALIGLSSLLSLSVLAQDSTHKGLDVYNKTVDTRQAKQQERYDQGVANGSLNAREQARLGARLQVSEKKQEKANADGQLTRQEVASSHRTLHKNNRRLAAQKHD